MKLVLYSFTFIAAICVMNLNGVGVLMLGVGQLFSPFLLLFCCLGYFWSFKYRPKLSVYIGVYILALSIYVFVGLFASVWHGNERINLSATIFFVYFTALFVILSVYLHVKMLGEKYEDYMLNTILILIIAGSSFIPFSDLINTSGQLVTTSGRGTGVFANPNEAGMVAATGFAAAMAANINPMLKRLAMAHLAFMVILTFSKTSLALVILLYFAHMGLKRNIGKSFGYIMFFAVVGYGSLVTFQDDIVGMFDPKQGARIGQVIGLITGEGDYDEDELTSGRSELWEIGERKIAAHPIIGNGLGELHSMREARASVNSGKGQGVHNTYLLKIGDSGILAITSFVGFIIFSILSCYRYRLESPNVRFAFMYFIVFAINAVSSHGMELLRFHNFFLGACLAFLGIASAKARAKAKAKTQMTSHRAVSV